MEKENINYNSNDRVLFIPVTNDGFVRLTPYEVLDMLNQQYIYGYRIGAQDNALNNYIHPDSSGFNPRQFDNKILNILEGKKTKE